MKPEPHPNCSKCPRLRRFIAKQRRQEPDWFNAPVPTWLPASGTDTAKLLIVGLAPALRGANRTGRAFTGDASGLMLHKMLLNYGFAKGEFRNEAHDDMELVGCAITNAVRCVPPGNKPLGAEVSNCQKFLGSTIENFPQLRTILTLGKIAHDSTVRTLGFRVADYPFAHGAHAMAGGISLVSSYHCSRYNVNTGRLTETMFEDVFAGLRAQIDG